MGLTIAQLRNFAISASLDRPATLGRAIARLGFVQADPIRSPARAQDLILRHRAKGYQAGDLEARYESLGIEEDFLYAYGFMPRSTRYLLHPRTGKRLGAAEKKVLDIVSREGKVHPRDLERHLGRKRQVNAWGGYLKATTHALHSLHHLGFLRIAGREKGIRMYEACVREQDFLAPQERLRRLVLLIAKLLAPVPERSLQGAVRLMKSSVAFKRVLQPGDLDSGEVAGVRYVWPAQMEVRGRAGEQVRFLAPFDPIVWDRARFEHFWEWAFRFEAYTPPAKRKMGYYAMPLLWQDRIIGWVNVSKRGNGLQVETGFREKAPLEAAFRNQSMPKWNASADSSL